MQVQMKRVGEDRPKQKKQIQQIVANQWAFTEEIDKLNAEIAGMRQMKSVDKDGRTKIQNYI